jgi:hypothetical protein
MLELVLGKFAARKHVKGHEQILQEIGFEFIEQEILLLFIQPLHNRLKVIRGVLARRLGLGLTKHILVLMFHSFYFSAHIPKNNIQIVIIHRITIRVELLGVMVEFLFKQCFGGIRFVWMMLVEPFSAIIVVNSRARPRNLKMVIEQWLFMMRPSHTCVHATQ